MSNINASERQQSVGASEVASVFSVDLRVAGQQAYASRFQLWAEKSGKLASAFKGNERSEWGNLLEAGIATGCADRFGWKVQNVRRYIRHKHVDRAGCSLDFEIIDHAALGPGVLEIKNVDRWIYNGWPVVEGADDLAFVEAAGLLGNHHPQAVSRIHPWKRREPPLRLQLQVQAQLACTGRDWGVLALLVGGNDLVAIPYPRVEPTIQRIEDEIPIFWAEVDSGVPPPIDWSADARTIARLYGHSDPLKVKTLRGNPELAAMAQQYKVLGGEISSRVDQRDVLKAKMLMEVEDASKAFLDDGLSISAPMVRGKEIKYWREPYRTFRVNQRRQRW